MEDPSGADVFILPRLYGGDWRREGKGSRGRQEGRKGEKRMKEGEELERIGENKGRRSGNEGKRGEVRGEGKGTVRRNVEGTRMTEGEKDNTEKRK